MKHWEGTLVAANTSGKGGFTIVELLIVVVVIAILAAITIVSYNGITTRANNAAVLDAASKTYKALLSYVALTNGYPTSTTGTFCVTTETGCFNQTVVVARPEFHAAMNSIDIEGSLPKSVAKAGSDSYGINLTYDPNIRFNGAALPLRMTYYLQGSNQSCGLPNIANYAYPAMTTSATQFTAYNLNSNGKTLCWISIPGPVL